MDNLIRLAFCDNEGCILPGKGVPFPLLDLANLTVYLKDHKNIGFSICSGRSVPYIEAMVQAIDLLDSPVPCICEGGSVLYWPMSDTWEIISSLDNKNTLLSFVSDMNYREEPGKMACLSLYPNYPTTLDNLYRAFIGSSASQSYNITKSVAAVDITNLGVSKSYGVKEVCKRVGISLQEVLYIGDAQNDIEMLQLAGYSACPNNASENVKGYVDYVAKSDATVGVLEILDHFESKFCNNIV